jgi:hypothetical protein
MGCFLGVFSNNTSQSLQEDLSGAVSNLMFQVKYFALVNPLREAGGTRSRLQHFAVACMPDFVSYLAVLSDGGIPCGVSSSQPCCCCPAGGHLDWSKTTLNTMVALGTFQRSWAGGGQDVVLMGCP